MTPPPPPGGTYIFQTQLRAGGGFIETGGLFNLAKTMVSVHSKSDRKSEPGVWHVYQNAVHSDVPGGPFTKFRKYFLFNPKSWALKSVIPASYPGQFAPSELTRGGLEPRAIGEFSREA